MENGVLLITIVSLVLGLCYIIYGIFFDSQELIDEPPKRARDKNGRFVGDNLETDDVNEAWEGGVAPKRKRGRPKGSKNKSKTKKK